MELVREYGPMISLDWPGVLDNINENLWWLIYFMKLDYKFNPRIPSTVERVSAAEIAKNV